MSCNGKANKALNGINMHGGTIVDIMSDDVTPNSLMHDMMLYNQRMTMATSMIENPYMVNKSNQDHIKFDKKTGKYTIAVPYENRTSYFSSGSIGGIVDGRIRDTLTKDKALEGYVFESQPVENGKKRIIVTKDGVIDRELTDNLKLINNIRTAKNNIAEILQKRIKIEIYNQTVDDLNTSFNKLMNMEPMTIKEYDLLKNVTLRSSLNSSARDLTIRKSLELRNIIDLSMENFEKNRTSFSKEFGHISTDIANGKQPHCRFCGKFVSKDSEQCNYCHSRQMEFGFQSIIITPCLTKENMDEAVRLASLVRSGQVDKKTFIEMHNKSLDSVNNRNVTPSDLIKSQLYGYAKNSLESSYDFAPVISLNEPLEFSEFVPENRGLDFPDKMNFLKSGSLIVGTSTKPDKNSIMLSKTIKFGDSSVNMEIRPEFDHDFMEDLSKAGDWSSFDKWTEIEEKMAMETIRGLKDKYDGSDLTSRARLFKPSGEFTRPSFRMGFRGNVSGVPEYVTDGFMLFRTGALKSNSKYQRDLIVKKQDVKLIPKEPMDDYLNRLPTKVQSVLPSYEFLTNRNEKEVIWESSDGQRFSSGWDEYAVIHESFDYDEMCIPSENSAANTIVQFKKNGEVIGALMTTRLF